MNPTLHIFIKYNEDTGIPTKTTMNEHLKISLKNGKFVWGHFTNTKPQKNKTGLWKERTKYIDAQLAQLTESKTTLVFFYCRKSKELYVADLIAYYDREAPDTNAALKGLIPAYYHNKIGAIDLKKDINTARSYAFVEVTNLRMLDINDTKNIYIFKGTNTTANENVLESKGMASLLYVNLEQKFYDQLTSVNVTSTPVAKENEFVIGTLTEDLTPPKSKLANENSSEFESHSHKKNGKKIRKHSLENDIKNKRLGSVGEELVLALEKEKVLAELGEKYESLVDRVSEVDDGKGYDILSFEKLNTGEIVEKYIEVKTTESGKESPFFISSGEVDFSKKNSAQYYLYRVYDYNKTSGDAKFFVQKGSIEENYNLIPKNYVVYLK